MIGRIALLVGSHSRLGSARIVRAWRARGYGALGPGAWVGHGTRITNRANVFLGPGAIVYEGCHIQSDGGTLILGSGSHLAAGVYVNVVQGEVQLGDGVAVGPRSVLLAYTNHYEAGRPHSDVRRSGRVLVQNGAFLGAHVVVLPGITIGAGAIVGAGAVVTRDIPAYTVAVGVPARVIKRLSPGMGDEGVKG